jgi:glycosyltransferase involved in cell wall biosynthesis
MDFLVHTSAPCLFDAVARELGANIIQCLHGSDPWRYARRFQEVLRTHGPYDIVHCHVHHFSGYVLWLAKRAGVPQRIVHSHCGTSMIDQQAGPARRLYLSMMMRAIGRYATCGLAVSCKAAEALFGQAWREDRRWRILHPGIDLDPFRNPVDQPAVRAELGIPNEALVIGHVGGFRIPKNHAFLIRVAVELMRRLPNVFIFLVGDGPLRSSIEEDTARAGIHHRVLFAGLRDDIPRLLKGAVDVFLFPSLWEGLPLALLEAQAAGLPCVISNAIPPEVDVVPDLITRLSLDRPPSEWAEVLVRVVHTRPAVAADEALALLEKSPFNSSNSALDMERLYVGL